jgi:hypothetical protein
VSAGRRRCWLGSGVFLGSGACTLSDSLAIGLREYVRALHVCNNYFAGAI